MKKVLFALFLITNIGAFAQTQMPTAEAIVAQAVKKAKKENKKAMIIFHASWCGWCKKMDNSINDPEIKPLFDKSFVIEHLTVLESKDKKHLENPGGEALMARYHSEGFGIPLWFIFDGKGKLLVDSHIRPEGTGLETKGTSIIGCPASKEECDEFIKVLKSTTKLTDSELDRIYVRFRKNDPNFSRGVKSSR